MIATPMLGVMASAIGAGISIEIKPDWREPCIIWTAVVASSGSKKTPAMSLSLNALLELQRLLIEPILKTYEREVASARQQGIRPPRKPILPRLAVNDSTPEALLECGAQNPFGVLLFVDELAGLLGGFDRYSKAKSAEVSVYLEAYGGKPKVVDRKKGGMLQVERWAVSIIGTIQPGALARAFGREHYDNGLAFRFLFDQPPALPRRFSPNSPPEEQLEVFKRLLAAQTQLRKRYPKGHAAPLSQGAFDLFRDFCNEIGEEIDRGTEIERSILSKIEGATARIALVLSVSADLLANPRGELSPISAETMRSAIWLGRHYAEQARAIHRDAITQEVDHRANSLVRILQRLGVASTTREILQNSSKKFQSVEDVEGALNALIRQGRIEKLPAEESRGPGRPAGPRYQLRPSA